MERNIKRDYYSEVRCDYNDGNGYWTVDAWKNGNDDEEGKVIAVINDTTADVYYIEVEARLSAMVKEIVDAKVKEILSKQKMYLLICVNEDLEVCSVEKFDNLEHAKNRMYNEAKSEYDDTVNSGYEDDDDLCFEENELDTLVEYGSCKYFWQIKEISVN